jgi:hypothetical protein
MVDRGTEEDGMRSLERLSAARFWELFCDEVGKLVSEIAEVLGSQLREVPFGLRRLPCDRARGALEIRAGRSSFRLECALAFVAPMPRETKLVEIFGEETPLIRVYVYRDDATSRSWIAADPISDRWVSAGPDLGPVSLSDRTALERFVCSLLIDQRSPG